MPTAILFYDVVLWVHVMAVIIGLGGIFLAPVLSSHEARRILWAKYVTYGLLGVIVAGIYLASDRDLWSEVWVTIPLVIAVVLGGLASGYFAPKHAQLEAAPDAALAAQVRTMTFVAMGLVLLATFFMVTRLGA